MHLLLSFLLFIQPFQDNSIKISICKLKVTKLCTQTEAGKQDCQYPNFYSLFSFTKSAITLTTGSDGNAITYSYNLTKVIENKKNKSSTLYGVSDESGKVVVELTDNFEKAKITMNLRDGSIIYYAYVTDLQTKTVNKSDLQDENQHIHVDSYSGVTKVKVRKGDNITFSASGNITLGAWAGAGGPNGIDGFTGYNRISGFRHGSLLGRIGNSEWLLIGDGGTFTAKESGYLELIVNDSDPSNNSGEFLVQYSIK